MSILRSIIIRYLGKEKIFLITLEELYDMVYTKLLMNLYYPGSFKPLIPGLKTNRLTDRKHMKKNRLTPLGSMGWIPARNRCTSCYCIEYEDRLVILDAGTGLARFSEPWAQVLLKKYDKIIILLSHYHLDHVTGLIYLHCFFKDKKVLICGPGRSVYGLNHNAEEILNRLIAPPFFGRLLSAFPMNLEILDLETGHNMIDGLCIDTILQEHTDPSIGIKIENSICYLTDTACSAGSIDFARNCKLLLHEAWFDQNDCEAIIRQSKSNPDALKPLKQHSSAKCAAETARDARVDSLLLIHLNPAYEDERLLAMEHSAQEIFPASFLAKEITGFIDF
jgi:ribonuclease BN (tRNA processing enzyme)